MTPSIRTFLLINLLLSVTLITSLAIIGNLVLSHQDIQKQLDTQLIHTTVSMRALLSIDLNETDLQIIQKTLYLDRKIDIQESEQLHPPYAPFMNGKKSHFFIEFQVWNSKKQLVLKSPGAPLIPFSNGNWV